MRFKVVLTPSDQGFAVECPALRGCWSQGATEEEALANIADAIREYLAAIDDIVCGRRSDVEQRVREVEVAV